MIPSVAVDAHRAAPNGIQVEPLQQQARAGSRASSTGRQVPGGFYMAAALLGCKYTYTHSATQTSSHTCMYGSTSICSQR
jgi:acyl-CoA thioesterase